MQLLQQLANLSHRQDNGQAAGALGDYDLVKPGQLGIADHSVQKQDGRPGLRLSGRRYPSLQRQVRQERRHRGGPSSLGWRLSLKMT